MNVLFVCTGNTCRSPMAETLMDDLVDRSSSLRGNVKVKSAGTFACEGAEATPEAMRAMDEMGHSLKRHEAEQFGPETAKWADLILAVAKEQMEHMEVLAPEDISKMHTILGYVNGVMGEPAGSEYDIIDPFDEGMEEYRACARQLNDGLERLTALLEKQIDYIS